jgi:hypothetical protein
MDEIEGWRRSEIVGFSSARLRAEAREAELNQAIVEVRREDFLAGNFDLKSLFSVLFDRFYSEDFVLWLGADEIVRDGKGLGGADIILSTPNSTKSIVDSIQGLRPGGRLITMGADAEPLADAPKAYQRVTDGKARFGAVWTM